MTSIVRRGTVPLRMHAAVANVTRRAGAALWFVAAFALAASIGADAFYKTDGPDLLRLLHDGQPHPWHVGYLPLLSAWRSLLAAVGVEPSLLRLGTSFSAFGAAVGVAFFHLGLRRLEVEAWQRNLATLLLLLNPATLLFASVVEFHAPALGATGLAFWWTCVQVRRPTWWGMTLLGGLTHLAFLVHSSALLLPGWLLPFFLARRWRLGDRRRDLALAATAGATHALLWFALPRLLPSFYGLHADAAAAYQAETSIGRPQSIDYLPAIVVQEWLWPLLPVSIGCLFAAFRRALRPELTAFVVGLLPFLYLCVRQLVFEPEHGAYLLPLVPGAALLTAQALPRAVTLLAVVVSAALAVPARSAIDDPAVYDAFVAGLREAAAGRPFLAIVGRHDELKMAYARLDPVPPPSPRPDTATFLWNRSEATLPRDHFDATAAAQAIGGLRMLAGVGYRLLITDGAIAWLRDPAGMRHAEKPALPRRTNEEFAGPLFLPALEAAFVFAPHPAGAAEPRVFVLEPR